MMHSEEVAVIVVGTEKKREAFDAEKKIRVTCFRISTKVVNFLSRTNCVNL